VKHSLSETPGLWETGFTRGQTLRYMLLPQVLPRVGKLFSSGFNGLPYFIAVVFNTLGLIPGIHPCLSLKHRKEYSVLNVLGIAAEHLTLDWKNIDKIVLFISILSGIVLLFIQIALFFAAIFSTSAFAYSGPGLGPRDANAFFRNDNEATDIAFQILNYVFGIPGIYGANATITPFHTGLHALFQFYSFGMVLIGTIVIIYLATAIILETAESGVPFGKRFNKAWAPVRLILFFGLLLPTPNGINLAQYFLLHAAKLGSNVATNAWLTFDKASRSAYMGEPSQLVAKPNIPNVNDIVGFMSLARVCSYAEGRARGYDIQPYIVYGAGAANSVSFANGPPPFSEVVEKSKGGTVLFRFGVKDENLYKSELGAVYPYCGDMTLTVVDQGQPGAAYMQQAYIEMLSCMWNGIGGSAFECNIDSFEGMAKVYADRYMVNEPRNPQAEMFFVHDTYKTQILMLLSSSLNKSLDQAVEKQASEGKWNENPALVRGWAGAGIWFNKIAEQNGALTSALFAKPAIQKFPDAIEYIRQKKQEQQSTVPAEEFCTPFMANGDSLPFDVPNQEDAALPMCMLYNYWASAHAVAFFKNVPESENQDTTGNIIIDTMNAVMGTRGLFDMCKNTNIHPLAQLATLGKGLVEHSIRGFGLAAGVGLTAGLASLLEKQSFAASLKGATSFFLTFASIGLILGFILFYVLPFMPFIYFFFALMTWIKAIFEAMVGMPLWALAHLQITGEGMPGDAAEAGYFYILEIFLRPICIIIGFVGSIIIFASMVKVLNQIFYLVIANLSGHNIDTTYTTGCFAPPGTNTGAGTATEEIYKRGVIDEFFLTVIYAIIVYLIGLPCFKLVDTIPDNIMRWLGAGISSFGSQDGDPAEKLMRYVSVGAGGVGAEMKGGLKGFGFLN
jgi:conjugal transfer/type IV secretion protein DotA/TraY